MLNNTIGNEVICFILDEKNEVLLQKRSKLELHNPNKWSFCAGHVEKIDETLSFAMIREIKEELGLTFKNEDLKKIDFDNSTTHFYYTFLNKHCNDFKLQKNEVEKVKWININDVIEMMERREEDLVYSDRLLKVIKLLRNKVLKFLKVMFGNLSLADSSLKYNVNGVTIADKWNPRLENPREMGGFNFSTEDKIFRWLVRGDTIYDVTIPDDAEMIDVPSDSAPHGVFRTNKIIITNPRKMNDNLAMYYYKISNLPEKSYYKSLAGCAIRGYKNTCLKVIEDKVNKDNIDLVLSEWRAFHMPGHSNDNSDIKVDNEIFECLMKIKNS